MLNIPLAHVFARNKQTYRIGSVLLCPRFRSSHRLANMMRSSAGNIHSERRDAKGKDYRKECQKDDQQLEQIRRGGETERERQAEAY